MIKARVAPAAGSRRAAVACRAGGPSRQSLIAAPLAGLASLALLASPALAYGGAKELRALDSGAHGTLRML